MKDIPLFTCEYGTASLTLREIPRRQTAYIRILATQQPLALLNECVGFCRACGAEHIYATGDQDLAKFPHYTDVVLLSQAADALPSTDCTLSPVTEETAQQWRTIYNQQMAQVPGAASMSAADMNQLLRSGEGYFIYKDRQLLGIGKASPGRLDAVATLVPGAGADCVAALCALTKEGAVCLEAATANEKAMALYHRLGFRQGRLLTVWRQVFPL